MAKGITETDVHSAADALVTAGERPTVERIRKHLGTGSPNTVTRWLDTWWQGLGERLSADRTRQATADAPSLIATLATELWGHALVAARIEADTALAGDRQALDEQRVGMEQQLADGRQKIAAQQTATISAEQGRAAAEVRLADAERLIEHQTAQLMDLAEQRNALAGRIEAIEDERAALAERLLQHEAAARNEREALAQHVRALEDRSQVEVDRARQEARALQRRIDTLLTEHAAQQQALHQRLEESRATLAEAMRTSSSHQGRAEALERQIGQLSEWRAALQTTLAQARRPARKSRAVASPKPRPGKGRAKSKDF